MEVSLSFVSPIMATEVGKRIFRGIGFSSETGEFSLGEQSDFGLDSLGVDEDLNPPGAEAAAAFKATRPSISPQVAGQLRKIASFASAAAPIAFLVVVVVFAVCFSQR